ncbi:NAD(P)/FAD-dependent oxidoreductase [Nocardioides sp.]|uniref:NAD(P)/FAD-dependent oxidoreductase n=1 Tax=Nocardioides sp. TaxID=35761 RepID=UPI00356456CB
MPAEPRLLLVGAGHTHLHLLRNAERLTALGYELTLVAPDRFDYSGVACAVATGGLDPVEGRIDVGSVAQARVKHFDTRVTDVNLAARTVTTDDGDTLGWDLISFNVGSVAAEPAGVPIAGSAIRVKPLSSLATLRERLRDAPPGRGHHITIVGAGASGVELAANLATRPDVDTVRVLEAGPTIVPVLAPKAIRRLTALLAERGVEVRTDAPVREVTDDCVVLRDGSRVAHDIAIIATGLAPPALASAPPLGGPDGIPVRATLQHRDHDEVYAAGDCVDFLPGRLPRLGVYGVRQGPVLLAALEARARGSEAPTYEPQRRALAIMDLGGGLGLASRGRLWWFGRSSLIAKRWIDRRWIAGYRS